MQNVKFLSINKQYRRLFNKPIDPTMTWDSLEELTAYVSSPTSYVNQIVGCLGKAYIIVEQNGEKALMELGTSSSGGEGGGGGDVTLPDNIMDLINGKADKIHRHKMTDIDIDGDTLVVAGYHIGPNPPENTSYLWIDTSETTIDEAFSSVILDELRAIISSMNKEIYTLKQEIEDLKQNGGGTNPPISPEDDDFFLLFEDGSSIITENGDNLILEQSIITNNSNILTENGDVIITEDGYNIISEDTVIQEANKLLTENGDTLQTENNMDFVLE